MSYYLCPECGEPLIDYGGELFCESCDEVFDEFDVEEADEIGECDPEYDYDDGEWV